MAKNTTQEMSAVCDASVATGFFTPIVTCGPTSDVFKTGLTVALSPRLAAYHAGKCTTISVEAAHRPTEGQDAAIGPDVKSIRSLMMQMQRRGPTDSIVTDIGASSYSEFAESLQSFSTAEKIFDAFIVPLTVSVKSTEALRLITELVEERGIAAEMIKIVFTNVTIKQSKNLQEHFRPLIEASKIFGFKVMPTPIYHSEIIAVLRGTGVTVDQLCDDDTDYAKLIRAETDDEAAFELSAKLINRDMAVMTKRNLDQVFAELIAS